MIAAPPWLGPEGTAALKQAASRAGLRVDRVIGDAPATALMLPAAQQTEEQIVAVVDAGAGGIAASVLVVRSAQILILSSVGDDQTGGAAVDRAIAQHLRREIGVFMPPGEGLGEVLRQIAEGLEARPLPRPRRRAPPRGSCRARRRSR